MGLFTSKEVDELTSSIEKNIRKNWEKWDKGETEDFKNPDFIKSILEWRDQNTNQKMMGGLKKMDEHLHYKLQIVDDFNVEEIAKQIDKPDDHNSGRLLSQIDFDQELMLDFYWENKTGFLLTNEFMYLSLSGQSITDVTTRIYKKELGSIKEFTVKKSWVHSEILLNGESLGTFQLSGGGKKFIRLLLDSISNRCQEHFSSIDHPDSNQESDLDKLKKLKEMFDSGVLNEDEFNSQKEKILDRM
jgi:hypothetical protein